MRRVASHLSKPAAGQESFFERQKTDNQYSSSVFSIIFSNKSFCCDAGLGTLNSELFTSILQRVSIGYHTLRISNYVTLGCHKLFGSKIRPLEMSGLSLASVFSFIFKIFFFPSLHPEKICIITLSKIGL